jgi:hypothetical protein
MFTEGSGGAPGCIEYQDGCLFSHHDTDVARGNNSAWDLVRKHKFAHLDKECDPNTPIAERPSQKAMIKFASDLPEIRAMRAEEEFEDLGPLPEAPANNNWLEIGERPFRVLEAKEFAGGDSTEPEWQIEEFVPKVGVGISYGQSRAFKSFAILDQAAGIHRGVPWQDRPVRKGRAVIIVAEGAYGFKNRMRAYAKHHELSLDELPAVIPAAPQLFLEDQRKLKPLIDELIQYGATYVAIDNQAQCMPGGDESSTKDMMIMQRSYATIAEQVRCFVDAISHTGHGDQSHARGSSVQRPAVDVEVFHERDGQELTATMTVRKLKEGQDGAVFTIKMHQVHLGVYEKSRKPYGSLALEHVDNAPVTVKHKPGKHDQTVLQALDAFKVSPVVCKALYEAAAKRIPQGVGQRDRRTTTAREAVASLVARGVLELVQDGYAVRRHIRPADESCPPFDVVTDLGAAAAAASTKGA